MFSNLTDIKINSTIVWRDWITKIRVFLGSQFDQIEPVRSVNNYITNKQYYRIDYTVRERSLEEILGISVSSSVTKLDDLLDFGQLLKPLAKINLPKSLSFLGNSCKGGKIYHFLVKSYLGNFYRLLAIFFWSH